METILGLCIGVGLSAACGFRVFVPLLVMSILQRKLSEFGVIVVVVMAFASSGSS